MIKRREIPCRAAEKLIFPPAAASADLNALERQLKNLLFHSWLTIIIIADRSTYEM